MQKQGWGAGGKEECGGRVKPAGQRSKGCPGAAHRTVQHPGGEQEAEKIHAEIDEKQQVQIEGLRVCGHGETFCRLAAAQRFCNYTTRSGRNRSEAAAGREFFSPAICKKTFFEKI
jgi:hypothetical protein